MYMFFENNLGRVDFGFGGTGEINITELDGFGLVEKEYTVTKYHGYDGEHTMSETTPARTMTVAGDIRLTTNLRLSKILRVLSTPGYLQMGFGDKFRRIFCRRIHFSEGARNRCFMRFVIQFTADMPYFEDTSPTVQNVYKTLKLISTPFTLPKMFSTRICRFSLVNNGDVDTEPVFYIINTAKNDVDVADAGIEIKNETTGAHILIKTETYADEIITVDIPERKITSNLRGNIISLISDDTYLNMFRLVPGANEISATCHNTGERICVACEYSRKYIDALY